MLSEQEAPGAASRADLQAQCKPVPRHDEYLAGAVSRIPALTCVAGVGVGAIGIRVTVETWAIPAGFVWYKAKNPAEITLRGFAYN